MRIVDKTLHTLAVEYEKLNFTLQRLWEGMDTSDRMITIGTIAALFTLMFVSRMRRVRSINYLRAKERNRNIAYFYAAIVIIAAFSFSVDALIDTIEGGV
ncbi:MAG: hypothetical protein AAFX02_01145 [Pseudomonadota bacterium]